ncbi:MAG: hypothetical protein FJW68_07900 [Actinobacteria bacterium]|nr:hypothetical protein [Actinomycetota bacterium]
MENITIEWLLDSEPWIQYITRKELLEQGEDDKNLLKAHREMIMYPALINIIDELKNWPGTVISSHKSPRQFFHKISFLAELGFNIKDTAIEEIAEKMLGHTGSDGIIRLPLNIGKAYGGTGENTWGWALCDAPTNLYALAKMGLKEDIMVKSGTVKLAGLARENGWPCAVSEELGSWRGPGKKDDPCPYATLVMLKLLSLYDNYHNSSEVKSGIDCLCRLWCESAVLHPYIFYMGNDFRKLKAPLIWYDIIHVLDVLSRFKYSRQKPEVMQMLDIVLSKKESDGSFMPESIYMEYKGWDFGQKKAPSKYLTFLVYRILKRLAMN